MGWVEEAIAVAIVSAKPEGHFRSSPCGYFHGMGAGHDINLRMSAAISAGERSAGIGAMNRPSGPIR